MKFSIYQDSRKGRRSANQDRIGHCYSRDALFMALADGMGGHPRGELAAQVAIDTMAGLFRAGARPTLGDPVDFLRKAMLQAHFAIGNLAGDACAGRVPCTTCVACVVQHGVAYWVHAGDSRLYHLRGTAVVGCTRDHSQVQRLVDTGRLRAEQAELHPQRNRVYSCLGARHLPRMALSAGTALQAGDTVLLCSDGLWAPLGNRLIGAVLGEPRLEHAVAQLLDLAELKAGKDCDNLSAIALRWTG